MSSPVQAPTLQWLSVVGACVALVVFATVAKTLWRLSDVALDHLITGIRALLALFPVLLAVMILSAAAFISILLLIPDIANYSTLANQAAQQIITGLCRVIPRERVVSTLDDVKRKPWVLLAILVLSVAAALALLARASAWSNLYRLYESWGVLACLSAPLVFGASYCVQWIPLLSWWNSGFGVKTQLGE